MIIILINQQNDQLHASAATKEEKGQFGKLSYMLLIQQLLLAIHQISEGFYIFEQGTQM